MFEIILAEEQGASRKIGSLKKSVGTLVLTNKRLVFVKGTEVMKIDPYPDYLQEVPTMFSRDLLSIAYADIYSTLEIPGTLTIPSLSIDLDSIISVTSENDIQVLSMKRKPELKVTWRKTTGKNSELQTDEFQENVTGTRKKNLNDWADAIRKIKSGSLNGPIAQEIELEQKRPDWDSMEGKVLYLLGDLQSKTALQLTKEAEKVFGSKVDFEIIQQACDELEKRKLIFGIYAGFWNDGDSDRPPFYRKKPPLGEDYDLSS